MIDLKTFIEPEKRIIDKIVDNFASETGLFFDSKVKDKILIIFIF